MVTCAQRISLPLRLRATTYSKQSTESGLNIESRSSSTSTRAYSLANMTDTWDDVMDLDVVPHSSNSDTRLANLPTELVLEVASHLSEPEHCADYCHFAAITPRNWAILRNSCHRMAIKIAVPTSEDHIWFEVSIGEDSIPPEIFRRSRFILAISRGYLNAVKSFIRHGIDPNSRSIFGNPALVLAVASHVPMKMTHLLLERGADPNISDARSSMTPLYLAALNGQDGLVKLLMAHGASVRQDNAFHRMCQLCKIDTVQHAINLGADLDKIDSSGNSVVHSAAKNEDPEVLSLLFDLGIALAYTEHENGSNKTPLMKAVTAGRAENVRILLDNGADTEPRYANHDRPLHVACRSGFIEIAFLLIEAGADVNAVSGEGKTPLHYAAEIPSMALLQRLLEASADVSVADRDTKTPLHIAHSHLGNPGVNQEEILELVKVITSALRNRHSELGQMLYDECVNALDEDSS